VERLALKLFEQIEGGSKDRRGYETQVLSWAARLHEIGLNVAHSGYHKHSAYILAHADMPGFSKMEQQQLSVLVLAHRGSLDKLRGLVDGDPDWSMLISLRLAALFHRSRSEIKLPAMQASHRKSMFALELDSHWLAANPLTAAELRDEVRNWGKLGVELSVPQLAETESLAEAAGD
jgi:exopolyphosphatase/guanosine-5'-triphosphate,3'-diphosphate pyrophosphatase